MSRIPLTKKGEMLIKEKLSNLKFIERPKISEAIAEARAHGDLKENAEYHAAKELQGLIEAKIYDIDNEKELTFKIVGNLESDPEKGEISIDTPIAQGLVGKFVEDEIKIETPSGSLNFEILEVKHI